MTLLIHQLVLGPLQNNVYFLVDEISRACVVIDPSFEPEAQLELAREKGWHLRQIWLTHGHFDHTAGVKAVSEAFSPPLPIAMHPECFAWAANQPAQMRLGMQPDAVPRVDIPLAQGTRLAVNPDGGRAVVEVREVPGHNPGSVLFYIPDLKAAIVGDAIFEGSIGRTDLPGSDFDLLAKSIREQIYTLPEDTVLLPGHMGQTTVGHEKRFNPFVRE